MKRFIRIMKSIFLISIVLAGSTVQAQRWTIDGAHSSAQFSVKHLMVSNVKGEFSNISGGAIYDPRNLNAASLEATIDSKSVNSRQAKRDAHLKSADFLDVAKFPTILFKSTKFQKDGGRLKIAGNLTIHGVTRPVVLTVDGPTAEVKDPAGNPRIGASATTKISRKDFAIAYNAVMEAGGVVVGDEVLITLDVELIRQK